MILIRISMEIDYGSTYVTYRLPYANSCNKLRSSLLLDSQCDIFGKGHTNSAKFFYPTA